MPEIFPGYTVEKLEEEPGKLGAYKITGPKKDWVLVRNQVKPHLLFPVPDNVLTGKSEIRGHKWFSDEGGELKAL